MAAIPKPRKNAKKPKLPEPLPKDFNVVDIFKKKWIVGEQVGSGGFGIIHLAALDGKNFDYVMKVEFHENGGLYTELHLYRSIGKPEHIQQYEQQKKLNYLGMSACHGLGSFEYNGIKYRFLVLQRYGTDLQCKLDQSGNKFSVKTAYTIGMSVLSVLEYIHSCGYIHGDVKGANLLLGQKKGTENNVYLLDMGLAIKYITSEGHRKEVPDPKRAHNGTIEFISRDSHRGTPGTRRSDLETLGYNLLLWLSGNLPWWGSTSLIDVAKQKEDCMKDVRKFAKTVFSPGTVPEGIVEYLTYVQRLGFQELPNYDHLRKILLNAIRNEGGQFDGKLTFGAVKAKKAEKAEMSSFKENIGKRAVVKAPCVKRKREKTPITLDPSITPTPAMLALLNRK